MIRLESQKERWIERFSLNFSIDLVTVFDAFLTIE